MLRLVRTLTVLFTIGTSAGFAQPPSPPDVPPAARPSANFNVGEATNAWLAKGPPVSRAQSDAYFEGGYWLILWDFLAQSAILLLLLESGLSAQMRDLAQRVSQRAWIQTLIYGTEFVLATTMLGFPLTIYEAFFREHQYGLSNQTFAPWFRDFAVAGLVGLIFADILLVAVYAAVRRFPRTWPVWGAALSMILFTISAAIGPVYIAPLFNNYQRLGDQPIKSEILALARQNGIATKDVWQVDASRQSKRVSANVSGLFGTERITLNDNLLRRASAPAILAVMGHEMGHYVLHHVLHILLYALVALSLTFALLPRLLRWGVSRRGARWGVTSIFDLAALPWVFLIFTVIGFVFTPLGNTLIRTQEAEADLYGLNSVRQPDGFAEAALLLGEYRKLGPSPLEEAIFFDHPSGRTRIYSAMRWKAENQCLFDPKLPCASEPGK